MTTDETLSLDHRTSSTWPLRQLPQLYVVLQCDRPTALPSRHELADVDEVLIGRGTGGFRRRDERGTRRLIIDVPDRRMSAAHARIWRSGDDFVLEDLGSKNGTLLNGQPQQSMALGDRDLIQLGCTFFSIGWSTCGRGDFRPSPESGPLSGVCTLLPDLAARFAELESVARSNLPVLILGETGTGKELVARTVHLLSGRSGPLVAINCAALPQTLLEAELFGHRKGAFSGALEDRPGLVRASDGGTLFLDEIGDLPRASQPALLRVLQEREVLAIGATRPTPVDLRVVAATHRVLDEPDSDSFRADLRARLAGYTIKLPPLRERREDLGLLVASLLRELAGERAGSFRLTCGAGRWLLDHPWRLNIRELRQFLASAVARGRTEIGSGPPPAPDLGADEAGDLLTAPPATAASLTAADLALRAQLLDLLRRHGGNISAVARDLGKERIQIRRWIRRYGLQPSEAPPPPRSA